MKLPLYYSFLKAVSNRLFYVELLNYITFNIIYLDALDRLMKHNGRLQAVMGCQAYMPSTLGFN